MGRYRVTMLKTLKKVTKLKGLKLFLGGGFAEESLYEIVVGAGDDVGGA